tara:strand:- start:27355 stop:27531 length:177 start_codon:yes stop_codon:yes gene_type:complete
MSSKSSKPEASAERLVEDICRATRRHFSDEDKVRIVLDGLRHQARDLKQCVRMWNRME